MNLLEIPTLHSEPVISCCFESSKAIVASGCEGAQVCFTSLNDRTGIGQIQFDDDVCTSIKPSGKDGSVYFCSVGNAVYTLDVRKEFGKNSIVETFVCGDEEVNSIAINTLETKLAAGDDSGEIYCFDLDGQRGSSTADSVVKKKTTCRRVLRRGHTNVCSSILYRKKNCNEILSGGLDCLMIRWDPDKLKIGKSWTMPGLSSGTRTINPPMIHSIDSYYSRETNKELVAVARGDGCVAMYDADAKNQHVPQRQQHARKNNAVANPDSLVWMALDDDNCHTAACNTVCFSSLQNNTRPVLLSGGNDSRLLCWDWNTETPLLYDVSNKNKINCISSIQSERESGCIGVLGDVAGRLKAILLD